MFVLTKSRTQRLPPLSLPELQRFSAVLAPVVVSLRSASSSWTIPTVLLSVTSLAQFARTISSPSSNLSVRPVAFAKRASVCGRGVL
ncbi:hypothetical protein IWW38_005192 [Coemansia aciculifera]|uniref:Uncharacterized protein n=1 Tax=Coemansia aciculifera TaxID=417176 RepID=A0ACC1LWT3_9FUNG|nr:hypothetical protein IWW38_005192 [Coemansia aciculifera]